MMKKIISYKEFLNESKSSLVTEANQEEQIKKEVISKLSDFFGCAPGNLSKFNFDGNDNIKELGKALRSTSDAGTEQYYRIAIQMAKRDLGIHESEEVNEAKKQITIKFTKNNQSEVSAYVFNRLENDKLVDTGNNGPDYMDLTFDSKNHDKVIDILRRCDAIDSIDESEEFELNEAVSTPEELASFITKEEKHFAAFLKPKKLTATVNGKVVTIKPASGSFTITVDYGKSTIDTTGKPEWPESTSYVELMEYIKITKFKLNESVINEGKKEDLAVQLEAIFSQIKGMNLDKTAELAFTKAGIAFGFLDMLSKPGAIKNLQTKTPEAKKRITDAREALNSAKSSDEIKSILVGLIDTVSESVVNEAGDLAYWKQYETDNSPQAEGWESDQVRSDSGVKPLIDKCIKLWNKESESGAIDKKSEKEIHDLAMDFYKKFHYVTGSIVQAMIMQES